MARDFAVLRVDCWAYLFLGCLLEFRRVQRSIGVYVEDGTYASIAAKDVHQGVVGEKRLAQFPLVLEEGHGAPGPLGRARDAGLDGGHESLQVSLVGRHHRHLHQGELRGQVGKVALPLG
ncbi:hypothetical protein CEXT_408811 [Caerostris extrusa]|uniref:Uncharacterized protein n=1 Tax=Caerostris extrusa TaxID=172846 RepID=A0AAV4S441_CAEEX|nr:hypothetical protein CEXT_408811 [Caerostris extrusa]